VRAIFRSFQEIGEHANEQAAGLPLFGQMVGAAMSAMQKLHDDLLEECDREPPPGQQGQWTLLLNRLKVGIKELTDRSREFLKDHQFASDHFLSVVCSLDNGLGQLGSGQSGLDLKSPTT
jgi:hypothetical protein